MLDQLRLAGAGLEACIEAAGGVVALTVEAASVAMQPLTDGLANVTVALVQGGGRLPKAGHRR